MSEKFIFIMRSFRADQHGCLDRMSSNDLTAVYLWKVNRINFPNCSKTLDET